MHFSLLYFGFVKTLLVFLDALQLQLKNALFYQSGIFSTSLKAVKR